MESGTDLARRYYDQIVAPLLLRRWPGLPHSAARWGSGSDVLGLDDETSRDHDWGLRLTVLVDAPMVDPVDRLLAADLPETFEGHPTRFATTWSPQVRHRAEVATPGDFGRSRLGVDVSRPLTVADWLTVTGQSVLELVAGPVFVDTQGESTAIRERLEWYPDDVWRYVVATDWSRIGQELPFVGRTGARGDDTGSRVLTARLVGTAMHLGLLLERRWPPYPKWLGTLFAALPRAGAALPALESALAAPSWPEREAALCDAFGVLHDLQRAVGLPTGPHVVQPFYDRPFRGLAPVPELLLESVRDPLVRALPVGVGSLEQWVDNVAVLTDPARRAAAANVLRAVLDPGAGQSEDEWPRVATGI